MNAPLGLFEEWWEASMRGDDERAAYLWRLIRTEAKKARADAIAANDPNQELLSL